MNKHETTHRPNSKLAILSRVLSTPRLLQLLELLELCLTTSLWPSSHPRCMLPPTYRMTSPCHPCSFLPSSLLWSPLTRSSSLFLCHLDVMCGVFELGAHEVRAVRQVHLGTVDLQGVKGQYVMSMSSTCLFSEKWY